MVGFFCVSFFVIFFKKKTVIPEGPAVRGLLLILRTLLIDFTAGGNVLGNPFVRADHAVVPNGNVAQHRRFGVNDYIVLNVRVAFNPFDGVAVFI